MAYVAPKSGMTASGHTSDFLQSRGAAAAPAPAMSGSFSVPGAHINPNYYVNLIAQGHEIDPYTGQNLQQGQAGFQSMYAGNPIYQQMGSLLGQPSPDAEPSSFMQGMMGGGMAGGRDPFGSPTSFYGAPAEDIQAAIGARAEQGDVVNSNWLKGLLMAQQMRGF